MNMKNLDSGSLSVQSSDSGNQAETNELKKKRIQFKFIGVAIVIVYAFFTFLFIKGCVQG
jgi:hypothetical protein